MFGLSDAETCMTFDRTCVHPDPHACREERHRKQFANRQRRARVRQMVRRCLLWVLSIAVATALNGATRAALAGVADTPLPVFSDGKQSLAVMPAITGVVKRQRLQTDFLCTSFDSSPVDIGVEVFDAGGVLLNDVHAGNGAMLNVVTGQTVTFGTTGTAAYLESTIIALPSFSQSSARVVATSTQVRCNVMLLDDAVTPPVTVSTLDKGFQPVLGPVLAGVALPKFSDGHSATHAAVVPGVVKRKSMNTSFFCTSLAPANVDIGVQVFGNDGTLENDIGAGNGTVLNVAPGATVTVSTTGTAAFFETAVISTTDLSQGLARIVSTSDKIVCSAAQLDSTVTPPASMSGLSGGN